MERQIHTLPDRHHRRLVEIAVEHTRLAAEYGAKSTTNLRREEIRRRIGELRAERMAILGDMTGS